MRRAESNLEASLAVFVLGLKRAQTPRASKASLTLVGSGAASRRASRPRLEVAVSWSLSGLSERPTLAEKSSQAETLERSELAEDAEKLRFVKISTSDSIGCNSWTNLTSNRLDSRGHPEAQGQRPQRTSLRRSGVRPERFRVSTPRPLDVPDLSGPHRPAESAERSRPDLQAALRPRSHGDP